MKKNLFLLVCSLSLSCNNQDIRPTENRDSQIESLNPDYFSNQEQEVKIIENRIVFKDYYSYEKIIEFLNNKTKKEVDLWFLDYKIESLRDLYNSNFQNGVINNLEFLKSKNIPIVPDDIFSRILNNKGMFQIGSKVIKFDFNQGMEQNIVNYNTNNFSDNYQKFKTELEFVFEDKNKVLKKARPSDFVGGQYSSWYHSTAGSITVHGWNEMFGYYIGFGGSAYSNGNVDFMRFSASGNYRKSGLFGHGWREGNWNFEG